MYRNVLRVVFYLSILVFFCGPTMGVGPAMDNHPAELKRFDYNAEKMGVPVRISLFASDEKTAKQASNDIFELFDRLNGILSDYDPESEIIQVCRRSAQSGEFIEVSPELAEILAISRYYTELTHGTFDITVSPIVKLWRRSRSFRKLPPADYLAEAKLLVGNQNWQLEGRKIKILKPGVRFDVGGIAKGYALDAAWKLLQNRGITHALIDAGGDIRLGDAPPGKKGWNIGFASLDRNAKASLSLELANVGIASSGDTFRYVEIDSVRYSHLIDPRTGNPLTTHQVVSIVAPDATAADALASAVSVLGPQEGMKLVRSLPSVEALIFQLQGTKEKPQTATFHTPLFDSAVKSNR